MKNLFEVMKLSRYHFRNTASSILTGLCLMAGVSAMLVTPGCSAEDFEPMIDQEVNNYDADTQLVIELAVPNGETLPVAATRASAPEIEEPTQNPEKNELEINSLRLYLFNNNGTLAKNELLTVPSQMAASPVKSVTYEVGGLSAGSEYKIYLLANFGDDGAEFANETALKAKMIDYTSTAHNLVPGNLPMVYEGTQNIKIEANATAPVKQTVTMQFACVKLRYNLIFDKSNAETFKNFRTDHLTPVSLALTNVTKGAKIIWDQTAASYEKAENTIAEDKLSGYEFYKNYTKVDTTPTSGSDVADDVTVRSEDKVSSGAAGVASLDKWVLRGTTYLPERYVSDVNKQTGILFKSKLNGASDCEHKSVIGVGDKKNLTRGYYYEFNGTIENTGLQGVNWTCTVHEWQDQAIDVDFIHTYLTLSTTEVTVTSFENGDITYETDGRGTIGFKCADDAKVGNVSTGKDLFELAPMTTADGERTLSIRVNSDVNIEAIPESQRTGTAHVYIIAGNIKKQITVTYDIAPFFEITPKSLKIQDGDGISADQRYFEYRTNLGQFTLKGDGGLNLIFDSNTTSAEGTNKLGTAGDQSEVKFKLREGSDVNSGILEITGTPASTTIVHDFTITHHETADGTTEEYMTVEVMPKSTYYRVYFRAINDYTNSNDEEYLAKSNYILPAEQTTTGMSGTSWIDYWNTVRGNETLGSSHGKHYLYAYTQYGENAGSVGDMPVWEYTNGYNNNSLYQYKTTGGADLYKADGTTKWNVTPELLADANNPGWYYYDLPKSCQGKFNDKTVSDDVKGKYEKGPIPGATMLIVHNGDGDDIRHRVNFHEEPGVPLGDDSDDETWLLYDPLREPVYNVFSDKPIVVNTTYTVFSDTRFNGWTRNYRFKISSSHINEVVLSNSDEEYSKGYRYKYTFDLKAPRGEYDKDISMATTSTANVSDYAIVCLGLYGLPAEDMEKWGIPHAEFSYDGDKDNTQLIQMEPIPGETNEYYVKVPDKYKGKKVKFCSGSYSISCRTWKVYDVPSTNEIKMAWTNSDGWEVQASNKITSLPLIFTPVTPLFNGRNWRTGYYKGGTWYQRP